MASNFDLTRFLPQRYRDKTIDTLLKSLFNRQLTKEDTINLFGYIGDQLALQPGEVQVTERDLERQLNQLSPVILTQHATESHLTSWVDLLQKLILLGVDYQTLNGWLRSKSYNLVPPIDLDKLCNFNEYFWVGGWLLKAPSLDYTSVGIPDPATYVLPVFNAYNPTLTPEYYAIQRGDLDGGGAPLPPTTLLATWTDWSFTNLWVHKEDAIAFMATAGGAIGFEDMVQATRPIIEYGKGVRINIYQDALSAPADSGTLVIPRKLATNQLPLFDLYARDGSHTGLASAIFYYQEGSQYPVDAALGRRLAVDANADFIFEHSLVDPDTTELLFYQLYDPIVDETSLETIWRQGLVVGVEYVKYDTSGTLINQDKFNNFSNYFWTGIDAPSGSLPSYNPAGLAEYYVIEQGGTSPWSVYNFWTHVSQLKRSDLIKYVQATQPIIEFNGQLEAELIGSKVTLNQPPKFKHYLLNQATSSFEQIVSSTAPNLNDAYLQGHLLAKLSDLGPVATAVLGSPETLASCFTANGEQYLQGLFTGEWLPDRDGVVYGYLPHLIQQTGVGNGALTVTSSASSCTPEVVVLTFNGATFQVVGSLTGAHGSCALNAPYAVSGVTFQVNNGSTPFQAGDQLVLEIKSYVYQPANLYVKLGAAYRTLSSPISITNERESVEVITSVPSARDGVWAVPPQLEWNVINENRSVIGQGDLYYHLISIIKAQPGLLGSEAGSNNYRTLTADVGRGGAIKQYDGDLALLISILLQEGLTYQSLIDFALDSYTNLFVQVHQYVTDYVPSLLSSGSFTPPVTGDAIDPALVTAFKAYLAERSSVVLATASSVDDHLAAAFYDSTSSIYNLVATLPYLGLAAPVQPAKVYDQELFINMLLCHDGHEQPLPSVDVDTLKKLVLEKYERSPGQETAGIITGYDFPARPYQNQFWFKTSTNQLFYYRVDSDAGAFPSTAIAGDYSYDRSGNILYQFDGTTWTSLGGDPTTIALPWREVKLDLIEANLILALEQELYVGCPTLNPRLSSAGLQTSPLYAGDMQAEFQRFGVKYGLALGLAPVNGQYGSFYDASNAFTWNYSAVTALGATGPFASWQKLYLNVYGTPRPDLQPWIPANLSEATLIANLIAASAIPGTVTAWYPSLWTIPAVATYLRAAYVGQGRPSQLSVDLTTGAPIAPYGFGSAEELVTAPPSSAANLFGYGDYGPIEVYWTRTADYLYSQQKVYFKLDPLTYVRETWGIKHEQINEYVLNSYLGRKEGPKDFLLHGEPLNSLAQAGWINVEVLGNPGTVNGTQTYTLTCVSRQDGIFKVTGGELAGPTFAYTSIGINTTWLAITFNPGRRGFFWGDTYTVSINPAGDVDVSLSAVTTLRAEGWNQLYVQYGRIYGQDLSVSINRSFMRDWVVKLGYRFGGLINTDAVSIKSQDQAIDTSAFSVYLKENPFYASTWLDALRIQLVQRGSTARSNNVLVPKGIPGGQPGDDWVFRVDNYNEKRPELTWYTYDTTGEHQTFIALSGKTTSNEWRRYTVNNGTLTVNAPFLITGIQNVINFIFGYADARTAEGWRFNDQDAPILDPTTGRPMGYQLLVEQFISQQFAGVEAGSAFLVNPFQRKAWFLTPHGVVSDLGAPIGFEEETVTTLLDAQRRRIDPSSVRVFRQDDVTELVFDKPAYTLHLLVSEYEHVVLFESYSVNTLLLYDPFLGQRASRMFVNGSRQSTFTGKLDLGGHFLLNDQMKRNIEASVDGILQLYDSTAQNTQLPEIERARSLLGFQHQSYFDDRGTSAQTEFRFWQGMIKNKGTNFAVDAYLNSQSYKAAKLDEYWAYKVAEYGDARPIVKAELCVEPDDCQSERTNYLFVEPDELGLLPLQYTAGGFDVPDYDVTVQDAYAIYYWWQQLIIEYFDPRGCIIIKPDDESRWFRYSDLNALSYFVADPVVEFFFVPTSLEDYYQVTDNQGNLVKCDAFELWDPSYVENGDGYDVPPYDEFGFDVNGAATYYETGEYILGTNPPEYSAPKFKRLNHCTIQVTDPSLLGYPFKVVGYAPAFGQYSPSTLVNYRSNTLADSGVIWWDPARGIHHPQAWAALSWVSSQDPAGYNQGLYTRKSASIQPQKPWGKAQVGKLWWNQATADWQPYWDTKIFPEMTDRLSRWGALTDYSTIDVYEWATSSVTPDNYTGPGEPGISQLSFRTRTWLQRPIAWRYSPNPLTSTRSFLAYQPDSILLSTDSTGYGLAVFKGIDGASLGFTQGTKLAGVVYDSPVNKLDDHIVDMFGTATVTSTAPTIVVGTSDGYNDGAYFVPSAYLSQLSLSLNDQVLEFRRSYLGEYKLSNSQDATTQAWYITLTHVPTGDNQTLLVHDTPINANTQDTYNFDDLGLKLSYAVTFGHDSTIPLNPPSYTTPAGIAYDPTLPPLPFSSYTAGQLYAYWLSMPDIPSVFPSSPMTPKYLMYAACRALTNGPAFEAEILGTFYSGDATAFNLWVQVTSQGGATGGYFNLDTGIAYYYNPITQTFGNAVSPINGIPLPTAGAPVTSTGDPSIDARLQLVAISLGNQDHEIFLRSAVSIFAPIAFTYGNTQYTELQASGVNSPIGWIAWNDPTVNPLTGSKPPFNHYEPVAGSWSQVGNLLVDLAPDITQRLADPWLWFDGNSYVPYKAVWTDWSPVAPSQTSAVFSTTSTYFIDSFFQDRFSFPMSVPQLQVQGAVYLNGVKLRSDQWSVGSLFINSAYIFIAPNLLKKGDLITVIVAPDPISDVALKFDPAIKDDPLTTTQYKRYQPYVEELTRDPNTGQERTTYYFWVKSNDVPAPGQTLSALTVQTLLTQYDKVYETPQAFKYHNQLDGRPNRYALMSVKGLGSEVRQQQTYKLRLTQNPTLRNDDKSSDLKNVHQEWTLLRQYQPTLIPIQLWQLLTDALAGQDSLGQQLPFSPLVAYDDRHPGATASARYGFNQGQVFVNSAVGIATVKDTIMNTKVTKLVNGVLEPDYISYSGFDINQLDLYLGNAESVRSFMADLWRFAKPKQVNEIFFAVLQDAAAENLELTDFFKTSFISLSEVRTIDAEAAAPVPTYSTVVSGA